MSKRPMIYWSPAARSIRACIGVKPKVGGLVALRTLLLNGGWDLYWKEQRVLPLAVLKAT
jgi:hypothetical protein